jgi:hypothetical protein
MVQGHSTGSKLDETLDTAFPNGSQPNHKQDEEDWEEVPVISRDDCGKSRYCSANTNSQGRYLLEYEARVIPFRWQTMPIHK